MTEASGQSVDVLLERDHVVEARFSRSKDERDLTRSNALEDRVQRAFSRGEFPEVPAFELRPLVLCQLLREFIQPVDVGDQHVVQLCVTFDAYACRRPTAQRLVQ